MLQTSSYTLQKKAVMTFGDWVKYSMLAGFGFGFTFIFAAWWFTPAHLPSNFHGLFHGIDVVLFLLLTYIVWYQIINECFSWYVALFMKKPRTVRPEKNQRVAFLTAFVPGKEPYDVLENTLKAMVNARYTHDTWLLDEGNDTTAKEICAKYGVKHFSRKGIAKYNQEIGKFKSKTKAGNYNAWYDVNGKDYDFVAQIDVDFIPKPYFLTKTLGYFRDPQVAFVGSPQIYGNTEESWITKGASEQAYNFYGSMQKGLFGSDMQLLIGSNHIVRAKAHDDILGYSGHIVEDHLTGMKFYAKRWKSVYVPKVLAIGEGPSTWDAYFSQQMRWAYGLMDILFTQSPKLFRNMRPKHIINYYLLQQYYFYGIAQVMGVVLLSVYFIFGLESTTMDLLGLLFYYLPILVMQQIIFLWLQKFNIDPERESGLMVRAKLLNIAAWPIYFLSFIGVLFRKRLTYEVTPKGSEQNEQAMPKLFIPHFILGTVSVIGIILSSITLHHAMHLLIWAWITAIAMYYFVFNELVKMATFSLKRVTWKPRAFVSFRKLRLGLN